jgi:hypothetical protein
MRLILADKSAGRTTGVTSERLINLYAAPQEEGSESILSLNSVPGTRDFATLPGPFLRGLCEVDGVLYAISAGELYSVAANGTATLVAAISDDAATTMAGHRGGLTIASSGGYSLWDGSSLTQPGSGRISTVGSVAFLDQYTMFGDGDGREVEWTEAGDPADRNALYFGTAEATDDKITRIFPFGSYLLIFKSESSEIWSNTRRSGAAAFSRITGGAFDTGLLSFNLVTKSPNEVFFIGHDRTAYLMSGGVPQVISTPAVNDALKDGTPTHCFYYEWKGHRYCVVRFSDRPAWVFDLAMMRWHERSSGVLHGAWDITHSAYCYGGWNLGSATGRVYRLGAAPIDAAGPIRRTCVSRTLYNGGGRFFVPALEIRGKWGEYSIEETAPNWLQDELGFPMQGEEGQDLYAEDQGPITTWNRPGRIWCRFSRDGGRTFGRPKVRDCGGQGQYEATVRYRNLGQFRRFTTEVNLTDPVDVPLLSEANIEVA